MARSDTENQPKNDDFSRIFSEYRARIDEITRRTEDRFKSLNIESPGTAIVASVTTAVKPEIPVASEEEDEEEIPAAPYPELKSPPAYPALEEADRSEPLTESAQTLREARQQAKKIIEEAEHKVKKEAKKKTQAQVDKILERARKEAEDMIAATRQAAAQEKDQIIAMSRREAEQVIAEITEKCRQESQSKSSQTIAEARQRARKIMGDIIESGAEINRLMTDVLDRTGRTIAEFEARLREDTGDLARAIAETRGRLDEAAAAGEEEIAPEQPAPAAPQEDTSRPALQVRFLGERSNGKEGTPVLYRGQMEMKSSSTSDYQYLKDLKKYLVALPDVKYLQEYASEKEMSVLFDIREPLPLMEVLRQAPLVEDILPASDDDFSIVFRDAG